MARQVVVTGGGTGIGRAIAARFAADGDEVTVTGRRPGPLAGAAGALGPTVRAVAFDAADPAAVEAALTDLPTRVDVLVNDAGGQPRRRRTTPDGPAAMPASRRADLAANLLTAPATSPAGALHVTGSAVTTR